MPKDKSKKKKDKERGKGKEEEKGEGIPLKQMNEYRRSNRTELLTKEQHEARKAVVRGNNQKAEEAVSCQAEKRSNPIRPKGAFKHPEFFRHAVAIWSERCVSQGLGKDRGGKEEP